MPEPDEGGAEGGAAEGGAAEDDTAEGSDPRADHNPMREGSRARVVGIGDALGRYQLVEELGAGGMATVFRARDTELRRDVAVKVLFPHLARRAEVVRRFHREGRAAAGLEHPGILRVLDVGGGEDTPDPPYLVMELVRGLSLTQVVSERGPLLGEVAAAIGALIADALAAAHRAGVIHRDVKPANVMVGDGRILLTDFGVARVEDDESLITRTGALLGTPAFMSPEQASGAAVDARSDVYSLGATLYQLATGSLPFTGTTAQVVLQITNGQRMPAVQRRPAVGNDLSRLLDRMMAVEVAARPPDAAAAAVLLRDQLREVGLGEAKDVVAGYFAAPQTWEAEHRPAIVRALVRRAMAERSANHWPKALGLGDRAAALAPDDAEVVAAVAALAQRGGHWRRWAWIGVGLAAVAGASLVAWHRLSVDGNGGRAQHAAVSGWDSAPWDASPDGRLVASVDAPALSPDAAARLRDAVVPNRLGRADARSARVDASGAPDNTSIPRDAAATAPTPPPLPPEAPIAEARATIEVVTDTWCELAIDGQAVGRVDGRGRRFQVAPGLRQLLCSQGPGLPQWQGQVKAQLDRIETARGQLLAAVEVHVDVQASDVVVIDGKSYRRDDKLRLRPGRHRIQIQSAAIGERSAWVEIPRVARCALRASPRVGCHRLP